MNEQIKFDGKYYMQVKNYLDAHNDLHGIASFGGDGRVYHTSRRHNGNMKGLILQRCGKDDECVVSIINEHPSFDKIKSDLEEMTKK
jgi:hypothetical protein